MSRRDEFATFINAGTVASPDYVLLGEGITDASISYNPQTTDEVYIHEQSGTTEVDSYKPVMPIEAKHIESDEALAYLDELRKTRPVGSDAYSQIVNVWMYEDAVGDTYPAEEQDISIQFTEFGGPGGEKNNFKCQLNYRGDPTQGMFNPTTATFTENSE